MTAAEVATTTNKNDGAGAHPDAVLTAHGRSDMSNGNGTTVQFGELPEGPKKRGQKGQWAEIVDQLRQRPHEWAKIRTCATKQTAYTTSSNVKNGRMAGVPAGVVETAVRENDIWMRYVGDDAA